MTYQFGTLQIKESAVKPINAYFMESMRLEEYRGIFDASRIPTQEEIKKSVAPQLQRQIFSLSLANGPYRITYENSGYHALVCSTNSHVSLIRLEDMHCEFERAYDTPTRCQVFLNNAELQAYGRQKCVSIMNFYGLEVHRLNRGRTVSDITYLRRHMLLVDASAEDLNYTDITNGAEIAKIHCDSLIYRIAQDPSTAIIAAACTNSKIVRAFAPALKHPLFAIDCGEMVSNCSYDRTGKYLLCYCRDKLKVFDVRQTSEQICYLDCGCIDDFAVSQMGKIAILQPSGVRIGGLEHLLSLGSKAYFNSSIELFHCVQASAVAFRPYFDNLGISQNDGVQQILVPGSGAAEYDTFDINFYSTTRGRNEQLIRQQLDKLPWDLIGQSNALGKVHRPDEAEVVRMRNSEILKQIDEFPRAKNPKYKAHFQRVQKKIEARMQEEVYKLKKEQPVGVYRFVKNE